MPKSYKHILCLIFSVLSAYMMQGQALSSLGKAPEITVGSLPNGISYYIVKNGSAKGFADFALVQQGVPEREVARKSLIKSRYFESRTPDSFLADHGVGYGPRGFISYQAASTRFDFTNVPVYDQAVSDSTLMIIFGIADNNPYKQAVVVSGDVDPGKLIERMNLFSMTVAKREALPAQEPYQWTPKENLAFRITNNLTEDLAVINLIYSARRIPRESLDTAIPFVTRMYSVELGTILGKRLSEAFRMADVPLADLRYRYQDSSESPEDERYSISVYTSRKYLDKATGIVASVVASLDREGASQAELQDAKDRLVSEAVREMRSSTSSNAEDVDKCVSAYLYGSTLASKKTVNEFIARKRLSEDRELDLFNGFAKALLDSSRNLTLRYDVPMGDLSREDILPGFNSSWSKPIPENLRPRFKADYGDTLSLYKPILKSKFRSESAEPVSGGSLWTFANGIKVIFKKVEGTGEFNYALMLRGGYADVPGLKAGEGAFVADMLAGSRVAGLSGRDFHGMLMANGVTMNESVSLSDLRISGIAPSGKIQLVLQSLLSMANDRQVDREAFEYWRKGEALRLSMEALYPRDVNSLMDSILVPDYFYTDHKSIANLGNDLPERAERYFNSQFSKVNDGIMVIIGDLDPDDLKKMLTRTLGDFRTQQRFAPRPDATKNLIIGTASRTVESAPGLVGGAEIGAHAAASTDLPFTLANYMSFKVACAVFEKELTSALATCGAYAEVSERFELFPTERVTVYASCRPCFADGLPEGVLPSSPLETLEQMRKAVASTNAATISPAALAAYKAALLTEVSAQMARPETIVDNVLMRYSEGKDVVTGYQAAINGVTVDSVKKILADLASGAKVEYVIM